MTYLDVIRLTAGLLQFAVACYSLQLSRRFGTARVGWLVFGTFTLLAFAHSMLAIGHLRAVMELGVAIEITYAVVSILLLIGIAHLQTLLTERRDGESKERRIRAEYESQFEVQAIELSKANDELNKANEELRRIAVTLRTEVAAHKQSREQSENTFQELLTAARQTEKDLQQSNAMLQAEVGEQKKKCGQAESSRRELLTALDGVTSLSVIAADQAKSRISHIARASKQARRTASSGTTAPTLRRKTVPESLARLARSLSDDQILLAEKIESLRQQVQQIAHTASIPTPEPVADFHGNLLQSTTETGTELIHRETKETVSEADGSEVVPGSTFQVPG